MTGTPPVSSLADVKRKLDKGGRSTGQALDQKSKNCIPEWSSNSARSLSSGLGVPAVYQSPGKESGAATDLEATPFHQRGRSDVHLGTEPQLDRTMQHTHSPLQGNPLGMPEPQVQAVSAYGAHPVWSSLVDLMMEDMRSSALDASCWPAAPLDLSCSAAGNAASAPYGVEPVQRSLVDLMMGDVSSSALDASCAHPPSAPLAVSSSAPGNAAGAPMSPPSSHQYVGNAYTVSDRLLGVGESQMASGEMKLLEVSWDELGSSFDGLPAFGIKSKVKSPKVEEHWQDKSLFEAPEKEECWQEIFAEFTQGQSTESGRVQSLESGFGQATGYAGEVRAASEEEPTTQPVCSARLRMSQHGQRLSVVGKTRRMP